MPIKHACSSDVTFRSIPALTAVDITGPLENIVHNEFKRKYNNVKRAAAARRRKQLLRLLRPVASKRSVREYTSQRTKINNLVLRGDAIAFFRQRKNVGGGKPWWHGMDCCVRKCATWFTEELSEDSVDALWNMRGAMQQCRGEKDRNALLAGVIQRNFVQKKLVCMNYKRLHHEAADMYTLAPALLERRVCVNFFCKLMDISTKKYTSVKMHMDQTDVYQNRPTIGFRMSKTEKRKTVVNWIRLTAELHDPLPNRRELRICVATKVMVWEMYMDDVINGSDFWRKPLPEVSYDFFLRVWAQDIGRAITVRGKSTEFAVCTFCKRCQEKLANKRLSEADRLACKTEYYNHHKLVKEERMAYELRIAQAENCSNSVLSIALDGGDQGAFGSPFFKDKTKENDKWYKMRNYVVGVCIHNPDFPDLLFHHLPIFERGPNVTIEVIHRTLCFVSEQLNINGKSIPRKLYIQLDNCSRENKNQFLVAFLCDLVWKKVFDEVCVFYLPVGHTHFDPDALFSRCNEHVRRQHALCLEELLERFEKCKVPHPKTFRLQSVASFAQYCKENVVLEKMSGLSSVRGIRVMRHVGGHRDGMPCVSTRRTSSNPSGDDPWSEPVFPLKEKIEYSDIPDCEFKSIDAWKLERIGKGIQQFERVGADLLSVTDDRFESAVESLWRGYHTVRDCTTDVVPFHWEVDENGNLPYQPDSDFNVQDAAELHSSNIDVLSSDRLTEPASPINHFKYRGEPLYYYQQKKNAPPSMSCIAPMPVSEGHFALLRKDGHDNFDRGMDFNDVEYEVGFVEKVFRYKPNKVPHVMKARMESKNEKLAVVHWYEPTPGTRNRQCKDWIWRPEKKRGSGRSLVPVRDIVVGTSALVGFNNFQANGKLYGETLQSVKTLIQESILAVDDWGQ